MSLTSASLTPRNVKCEGCIILFGSTNQTLRRNEGLIGKSLPDREPSFGAASLRLGHPPASSARLAKSAMLRMGRGVGHVSPSWELRSNLGLL
jgi:hypothetical protein